MNTCGIAVASATLRMALTIAVAATDYGSVRLVASRRQVDMQAAETGGVAARMRL